MYPSLVDELSGLWIQISAREVVLSNHIQTMSSQQILRVTGSVHCIKNKVKHSRKAASPVHQKKGLRDEKSRNLMYNLGIIFVSV